MTADRQRQHYIDRMHRILGVCHACGYLWHEEKGRDGIPVRLEDVRPQGKVLVTPQYEKYGLHVNPRVLPKLRGMGPQFAYALNVPTVAVEVDGDTVYVRVPREREAKSGVVLFEQAWALAPDIAPGGLLLGIDEAQQQLVLDLNQAGASHCMVVGMTGSGKSTLMQTMILSAEMTGAHVALFDPSGGFQALSGHPSVWRGGLFRRAEDCEWGLGVLARSLANEGEASGALYIFVDEVPELVRQQPTIKEHLGRLAQAGRHRGYHLILGAQHPLVADLGAATIRNIPVSLVGKVRDKQAAYNATGRSDSGAENLRGAGDFMAYISDSKTHFQAAMPSDQMLREWAKRYPPRSPRIPPKPTALAPGNHGAYIMSSNAPSGNGPGGSVVDDIPAELKARIWSYYCKNDRQAPKPQWVRDITKRHALGRAKAAEYRYLKACRAIYFALLDHGVAYDGYDPNSQETAVRSQEDKESVSGMSVLNA